MTRMRINPPKPQVVWKTTAVADKDPLAFARALEGALQEMTDGGFQVTGQTLRDGAVIITGQKIIMPEPAETAGPQTQPAPDLRRRIVESPARRHGVTTDEVLYHYMENGQQKQLSFPSLVEALREVKKHLGNDGNIVPINLIAATMTHFELLALPMLLQTYAEDLLADKPLE